MYLIFIASCAAATALGWFARGIWEIVRAEIEVEMTKADFWQRDDEAGV